MKDKSKLYLNIICNGTGTIPETKPEEPKPTKKTKAKKKEK